MNDIKQNYILEYNEDGVQLSILPEESDDMMSKGQFFERLREKDIVDVDFSKVEEVLKSGVGSRGYIAPFQEEKFIPDYIEVSISSDKMQAGLKIIKGEEGGKRLTPLEIVAKLETQFKIVHGLDKQAIGDMINNGTYNQSEVVAVGTEPVDGVDGKIILHFETDFNKIGADVDGRIDFKQLNLFANVSKGSIVASKTRPVPGQDGMDILGNVLLAKQPNDAKFNYGKNVLLSTDGESLLSTIDGKADLVNNKVVVSKVYVVDGNVDMSVGNIDFSGDIVVTGSVLSGFTVNAGGSVDIYGIVEGAHIIADKNIRVAGGFLGNGKGMLNAGGAVTCKNVEHGIIRAVISIEADNVIHSNLYCEGAIKVDGGKSSVIGGNICSGHQIILNNVGAPKGTATTLRIGLIMDEFKRMAEIQSEEKENTATLKKLQMAKIKMMNNNIIDVSNKVKIMNEIIAVQGNLDKLVEDKKHLEQTIQNAKKGKICVKGRAYNGVDIIINDIIKRVDTFYDYTTFTVNDGEIREYPYN